MNKLRFNRLIEYYFLPKPFELNGKLYEYIGIKYFKKLVLFIGALVAKKKSNLNNYNLFKYSRDGLIQYEKHTRSNEAWHLLGTVVPLLCFLPSLVEGDKAAFFILPGIFLINFYPLCLQRYNRNRIYKVLNRDITKCAV